jgi:hypothetical protein
VLNCSLRSRGSRSKPPSSSHLMKPQLPHCPTFLRGRLHHLLLQIGGARSGRLNSSLPVDCSLRSRDARRNPAPSSPPVKRDPGNRHMHYALHSRLLQSPEASIKSRGSRSKPPSSSHLMKPQLPHCDPGNRHMHYALHSRLLQPPEASIKSRVSPSRGRWVRFPSQMPERPPGRPNKGAFAITAVKTYAPVCR